MEIKDVLHLYLGCEAMDLRNNRKAILANICLTDIERPCGIDDGDEIIWLSYEDVKPILRQLSSMTEEEAVEFIHLKNKSILCNIDRTEITKVSFGTTKNIINFSYFRRMGSGAQSGSETYYVNKSDPDQFLYLLSKSFDLFNLIQKGLAIDLETIKQ